jgi:transposase
LPAIRIEVTEHRAEKSFCQLCGANVTAAFPDGVAAPVQYGPALRATALYLGGYQMIPYQRLAETFAELFGCPLSQGTLGNIVRSGGQCAATAMQPVREALRQAPTAHADETGCTVLGKRNWLHVFSTPLLTSFHLDAKRGAEAMARGGMIPGYRGNLVHDCLGAYGIFVDCWHFYCNAHLQRELTYIHEEMNQLWAKDMIELLLEAKRLADRETSRPPDCRRVIGERTIDRIMARYTDIVLDGLAINPEPPPPPPGKRGRVKRGKPLNLLHRLDTRPWEIMGFFALPEAGIPYDNNQAERDLRMMKVREKISGTFRSETHGRAFCELRGIISSLRKQGRKMLANLQELIVSPATLGKTLAEGQTT